MKRRSVFAITWLLVASSMGVNAVTNFAAGDSSGYVFGLVAAGNVALASIYWFHPKPIERPDEPAPRWWFVLGGLIALALLGSVLLLFGSALLLRDSALLQFVVVG